MCISTDKSFAVFWNSFLSLYHFWVQKRKNQRFEEKKGVGARFIELNCRWLQTGQADLKKHPTLEFLRFF